MVSHCTLGTSLFVPAASAGDNRGVEHTATASSTHATALCLPPPPLQVTTGSDAYSFGVLMWTLYTGQQPYVVSRSGVPLSNPLFPHFPKAGHATHPQYICLAERCLRMDPHERPSFVEIAKGLLDFFDRECVAPGIHRPAPPNLPGLPQSAPATFNTVVPGPPLPLPHQPLTPWYSAHPCLYPTNPQHRGAQTTPTITSHVHTHPCCRQ